MTTPIVPDFIIGLYENEVRHILGGVLKTMSSKYGIDEDELESCAEKVLKMRLEIVPEETEAFKIVRKQTGRKPPEEHCRCIARLKKPGGVFAQCMGRKLKDEDALCKRHANVGLDKLKYGTIHDPPVQENLKRKKKNIY